MKTTKCFDAYGIYMLSVISFAVVCCKAFSSYWLAAIQVINGSGLSFLTIVNTVCQTLWHEGRPAIIGFALSFIMWQMVLLNSNIPGIDPPTPFTPKKLRARQSNRFHLDYIFAVIIGLFTTFTLVVREMIY